MQQVAKQLTGEALKHWETSQAQLIAKGVAKETATKLASVNHLDALLNSIQMAKN